MGLDVEKNPDSQQRKRLLFAGNGEMLMNDLIAHTPREYLTGKSSAANNDFDKMLSQFRPHAVIVCLRDETREALYAYQPLMSNSRYMNTPVIAIGREEECTFFKTKVQVRNLEVLVRPVSYGRIWEAVEALTANLVVEEEPKQTTAKPATINTEDMDTNAAVDQSLLDQIEQLNLIDGRKSILVVDDDVRMLNVIKLFLQDLYDITIVPSGKLALKFLTKRTADLVLLDYMMPEMDGPETLKKIRQSTFNPNIPVVFLTGVSERDMVLRCLEFRPKGYLLKPITRNTLLEKVTEVLLDI